MSPQGNPGKSRQEQTTYEVVRKELLGRFAPKRYDICQQFSYAQWASVLSARATISRMLDQGPIGILMMEDIARASLEEVTELMATPSAECTPLHFPPIKSISDQDFALLCKAAIIAETGAVPRGGAEAPVEYLIVSMNSSDADIEACFGQWLQQHRIQHPLPDAIVTGKKAPKKPTAATLGSWSDLRFLAFLDLRIWLRCKQYELPLTDVLRLVNPQKYQMNPGALKEDGKNLVRFESQYLKMRWLIQLMTKASS